MSANSQNPKNKHDTIWVLTDAAPVHGTAETLLPSAPAAVDAEKLGDQLQDFVVAFSKSLNKVQQATVSGYNLSQVAVEVRLSATLGLVLVGQAGVQGGIILTFSRK